MRILISADNDILKEGLVGLPGHILGCIWEALHMQSPMKSLDAESMDKEAPLYAAVDKKKFTKRFAVQVHLSIHLNEMYMVGAPTLVCASA